MSNEKPDKWKEKELRARIGNRRTNDKILAADAARKAKAAKAAKDAIRAANAKKKK